MRFLIIALSLVVIGCTAPKGLTEIRSEGVYVAKWNTSLNEDDYYLCLSSLVAKHPLPNTPFSELHPTKTQYRYLDKEFLIGGGFDAYVMETRGYVDYRRQIVSYKDQEVELYFTPYQKWYELELIKWYSSNCL